MNPVSLTSTIREMASQIRQQQLVDPLVIGIHTGGAWVAEQLHSELGTQSALGSLDISFYRDDFSRVGLNPKVKSSDLPETVEDRHILLVDDVLHTGRTIRAALNEIFSYGRPASVALAVALERPGRELPIQPDFVGHSVTPDGSQQARISRQDGELFYQLVEPAQSDH